MGKYEYVQLNMSTAKYVLGEMQQDVDQAMRNSPAQGKWYIISAISWHWSNGNSR